MTKAKQIEVPVLITFHAATDNTILFRCEDIFTIEKADKLTQTLHAVVQRTGKPVAEVLQWFAREAVKDCTGPKKLDTIPSKLSQAIVGWFAVSAIAVQTQQE